MMMMMMIMMFVKTLKLFNCDLNEVSLVCQLKQ